MSDEIRAFLIPTTHPASWLLFLSRLGAPYSEGLPERRFPNDNAMMPSPAVRAAALAKWGYQVERDPITAENWTWSEDTSSANPDMAYLKATARIVALVDVAGAELQLAAEPVPAAAESEAAA